MKTLFIAGTDTDVGKTFFCAHFLRYLLKHDIRAGYQKWVSTGDSLSSPDLEYCISIAGHNIDHHNISQQVPWRFALPASPHLAAEQEHREVDPKTIMQAYHSMSEIYDLLLVEGVGGLLVPLRRDLLLIDLIQKLQPPVLLIARSGLGTLNHTLLSLEALRNRDIPIAGVVFSDSSSSVDEVIADDNIKTVTERSDVKIFGRLHWLSDATVSEDFEPVFSEIVAAVTEQKIPAKIPYRK